MFIKPIIDQVISIISQVAQFMDQESAWQEQIIELSQVLEVDEFSDRDSVLRVWIKTELLK